jgi:hypothetical protein
MIGWKSRALREHGITQLLEFLEDLMVDARIVVIRPGEHDDADPVFALELVQDVADLSQLREHDSLRTVVRFGRFRMPPTLVRRGSVPIAAR